MIFHVAYSQTLDMTPKYKILHFFHGLLIFTLYILIHTYGHTILSCQDWGVVDEMSGGILINSFVKQKLKVHQFSDF